MARDALFDITALLVKNRFLPNLQKLEVLLLTIFMLSIAIIGILFVFPLRCIYYFKLVLLIFT